MRSILQLLKCFSLFALTLLSSFCKKKKNSLCHFCCLSALQLSVTDLACQKVHSWASAWFYRRNNQVHSPHFNILACKIECCLKILAFAVFFFITLFWTHTKACRNRRRYLLAVYQPVISVSIFLKMWDALTLDIIMSTAMFCIKLDFLYCPLNYSGASDHGYMSLQRKWTPNGLLLE